MLCKSWDTPLAMAGFKPALYNCLAAGSVSGNDRVGGVCGYVGVIKNAIVSNVVSVASVFSVAKSPLYIGAAFGQITRNDKQTPTFKNVYYLPSANEGMQAATITHYNETHLVTFAPNALSEADLAEDALLLALSANAAAETATSCKEWKEVTFGGKQLPCPVELADNFEVPDLPSEPDPAPTPTPDPTPDPDPTPTPDPAVTEFEEAVAALSNMENVTLSAKYSALYAAAQAFDGIEDKDTAKASQAYADYLAFASAYNAAANNVATDIRKVF